MYMYTHVHTLCIHNYTDIRHTYACTWLYTDTYIDSYMHAQAHII